MSEHPTVHAARDAQPEGANTADGLARSSVAGSAADDQRIVAPVGVEHRESVDSGVSDRLAASDRHIDCADSRTAGQVTDHIVGHDIDGDSASASGFVSHASTESRRDRILTAPAVGMAKHAACLDRIPVPGYHVWGVDDHSRIPVLAPHRYGIGDLHRFDGIPPRGDPVIVVQPFVCAPDSCGGRGAPPVLWDRNAWQIPEYGLEKAVSHFYDER